MKFKYSIMGIWNGKNISSKQVFVENFASTVSNSDRIYSIFRYSNYLLLKCMSTTILSEMKSFITSSTLRARNRQQCTWQTTTLLRHFCVMVLRKYVFNLLRALKLLSASQLDAGETIISLISLQTSLKKTLNFQRSRTHQLGGLSQRLLIVARSEHW